MNKLFATPFVALLMAATGQTPTAVMAPSASLPQPALFIFDGGSGSTPPVATQPLYAPAYFTSAGTVPSVSGADGGIIPSAPYIEFGSVSSATAPTFTILEHTSSVVPYCTCSNASGTDIVKTCSAQVDAGGVLAVVIDTVKEDGGLFNYVCAGF